MLKRALALLAIVAVVVAAWGTAGPLGTPVAEADGHSATRTLSATTVEPGGQITVTITASGLGTFGSVTETLPAGFTYVSTTFADGATTSGQDVNFVIFGDDATFSYTVTASDTAGSYSFSGTTRDGNRNELAVGGASSVTVEAAATGHSATRSLSSPTVDAGAPLTVTIAASGLGSFGSVEETLPSGFTYLSTTHGDGATTSGQKVTFVVFGDDATFSYTVTASSAPGSYSITGAVKNDQAESAAVGGSSSVTVASAPTGASATRSLSSSAVQAGEQIVVTISASGLGVFGSVAETIPAGFAYVSSTHEDTAVSGQNLTFTILHSSATFTYTVTAASTDGVYGFSGTVTDDQRRTGAVTGTTAVTVGTGTPPDGGTGGGGGGGGTGPDNNRPPAFSEGARANRAISEGSSSGADVGAAVTALDPNDDDLIYSVGGPDGSSFDIGSASGQITVGSGTDLDHEAQASYSVQVVATDPGGRADTIEITISVINEDEDGSVALSPAAPMVQSDVMAAVSDPDGEVSGETWSWERSADGEEWTAIEGAAGATYEPAASDAGMWLRATAAYSDGHGADKTASGTTEAAVAAIANAGPRFPAAETGERSVPEDASAGTSVGDAVAAPDPDGDALTYTLGGEDAAYFTIDAATGQITTVATLDYETQTTHSVTVTVSDGMDAGGGADGAADDEIAVTISVTDVEEMVTPEPEPEDPGDGDKLPDTGGAAVPAWLLALAAAAAAAAAAGGARMARASARRPGPGA